MSKSLPLLSTLGLSILAVAQAATATPAQGGAGRELDACRLIDAASKDPVVQVPFDVVDGRIYVQARVNDGGPYRFAIDTGASGVGRADTTLVSALGLRPHGKTHSSDGVQAAAVDTVQLDSLVLGGLEARAVDVITRDYGSRMPAQARFHGIIARDFFAGGLLVLDYPARTLSFSRKLSLPSAGKGILRYERAFRVPVSVGGVRTEANLDTGANIGLVMPMDLYTQVAQAPLEPAGTGTLTNTRIATWRGVVPGPVTIGSASLANVEVRVSDRFPELLVGAHVLQEFVVLIDQRAKRIALCNRGETARREDARLP